MNLAGSMREKNIKANLPDSVQLRITLNGTVSTVTLLFLITKMNVPNVDPENTYF